MIVLQSIIQHREGQLLQVELPPEIAAGSYELVLILNKKDQTEPSVVETELSPSFEPIAPMSIPREDLPFLEREMKQMGAEGIDPFEDFK